MPIRVFAIVLAAALGLTGSAAPGRSRTPAPPTVRTQPTFFISGHGWGHGIGMSQYGAYGYALHGWTYDRIVKHYYTGTTIGKAPATRVRVLLADRAKQVTIASKLPFQVVDASGSKHALDAGSYKIGAAYKYQDPTNPQAKSAALAYPLEFRPGATAVSLNGRGYRGSFRILKLSPTTIRVVNVVDLDLYLRGVVPSEMPKGWAPEALKAQAAAARPSAPALLHPAGPVPLRPRTSPPPRRRFPPWCRCPTPTTPSRRTTTGAVPLHGAEARARPEGARQADGRSDARFLLGSRAERGRDRLEGAGAGDGLPGTSGARASVDLVPGWRPRARRPGDARDVRKLDRPHRHGPRRPVRRAATAQPVRELEDRHADDAARRHGHPEGETRPVEPLSARRRRHCERGDCGLRGSDRSAARSRRADGLLGHRPTGPRRDDRHDPTAGGPRLAGGCERQDHGQGPVHAVASRRAGHLPRPRLGQGLRDRPLEARKRLGILEQFFVRHVADLARR